MPKGPQGQWRPADPIAAAVHVAKIATGQIEETYEAFPLFARSTGNQRLSHDPMRPGTQIRAEMTTCNHKRLAVPLAVRN